MFLVLIVRLLAHYAAEGCDLGACRNKPLWQCDLSSCSGTMYVVVYMCIIILHILV